MAPPSLIIDPAYSCKGSRLHAATLNGIGGQSERGAEYERKQQVEKECLRTETRVFALVSEADQISTTVSGDILIQSHRPRLYPGASWLHAALLRHKVSPENNKETNTVSMNHTVDMRHKGRLLDYRAILENNMKRTFLNK